ncbi:hypothetical protein GGR57DRAFT_519424 [Xylariaceae sp. FL1272]|nr:hypothetical protein GGR57DRAFT_519424 [Xylariaceae sp. FL1272]
MSTRNKTQYATTIARYTDTGPLKHSRTFEWTSLLLAKGDDNAIRASDGALLSSLTQPRKSHDMPTDIWGNVKVPRLESTNDSRTWIDTGGVQSVDSFTSVLGVPISSLPPSGRSSLFIETSYLDLNCSGLQKTSMALPHKREMGITIDCPQCPHWDIRNIAKICAGASPPLSCKRLATFFGLSGAQGFFQPIELTVHIWATASSTFIDQPSDHGWFARCVVKEKRVEAHVVCAGWDCHTKAIRSSQVDKRPESVTAFDYWAGSILSTFKGCSIVFIRYLSASSQSSWSISGPITLSTLVGEGPNAQLSVRLTSILNGLLRMRLDGNYIPAATFTQPGWGGPHYMPHDGLRLISQSNNIGEPTIPKVYDPVTLWVVILLLCSLTALTVCLIGIMCDMRTLAPRIFDPVLSFTYDAEKFDLEPGGTTLDMENRAEVLGDLQVRIGDVKHESEVGSIGFGVRDKVKPLITGRLYE